MLAILRRWCRSTTAICLLLRLKAATRARHRAKATFDIAHGELMDAWALADSFHADRRPGILYVRSADQIEAEGLHLLCIGAYQRAGRDLDRAAMREEGLSRRLAEIDAGAPRERADA